MTDQTGLDLTRREIFRHFTPVTIRFSDTDKLGHVNNVSIASYFEASRCELFDAVLKPAGLGPDSTTFWRASPSISSASCTTQAPSRSAAASCALATGRSLPAMALSSTAACFATGEAVNVFFNLRTRMSVAPTPELRSLILREIAA